MREATHLPFRAGYNWVLTAMVGALKKPDGSMSVYDMLPFFLPMTVIWPTEQETKQDIVSARKKYCIFLKFTIDFFSMSRYNVLLHEEKLCVIQTLLEEV